MFDQHFGDEFHALQCQHCKDLQAEAERARLVLQAQKAQPPSKLTSLTGGLLSRLSAILSKE